MANLYSIYDSQSGLCLGQNKTASQIADLFGVKLGSVYRTAIRGHILNGKYRIKITGEGRKRDLETDDDTLRIMEEWEDVTEKMRAYFQKIRKELGK